MYLSSSVALSSSSNPFLACTISSRTYHRCMKKTDHERNISGGWCPPKITKFTLNHRQHGISSTQNTKIHVPVRPSLPCSWRQSWTRSPGPQIWVISDKKKKKKEEKKRSYISISYKDEQSHVNITFGEKLTDKKSHQIVAHSTHITNTPYSSQHTNNSQLI